METEIIHNPITGETLYVLESNPWVFKFEFRLKPNGAIGGEHFHPSQEQTITVVSGELHYKISKKTKVLRAGESVTIPARTSHFQSNPTDQEVVAIEEHRPANRIHLFFRVLFAMAWDGETDLDGLLHPLIGAALLAEFKDVIRPARSGQRLMFDLLAPVSHLLGYRQIIRRYISEFETGVARGHIAMRRDKSQSRREVESKISFESGISSSKTKY
jgi:hypothetical protein